MHHARAARNATTLRGNLAEQGAVVAHGRRNARIGIVGYEGTYIRIEFAGFGIVAGGAHGIHLVQTQNAVEGYEARINMLARGIDDVGFVAVEADFGPTAHIGDLAFVETDDALNGLSVTQMQRCAGNPDGFGLGFAGCRYFAGGVLCVGGQRKEEAGGEEEIAHGRNYKKIKHGGHGGHGDVLWAAFGLWMRCALLTASGLWLAWGWGCPVGWVGMQSSENFLNQRYLLAIF